MCKFVWATSAWYILDNANVGGTVTFKHKYLMKNNFIFSVLGSSRHQLLDSGIKSRMFRLFKKIDMTLS